MREFLKQYLKEEIWFSLKWLLTRSGRLQEVVAMTELTVLTSTLFKWYCISPA